MHAISRGEKRNERVGKKRNERVTGDQTTAVGSAREYRRGLQPSGGEGRIAAGLERPAREYRRGLQPCGDEGRIAAGLLLVPAKDTN